MLRDIERGAPTEGEHVLGDLLARAQTLGVATPILNFRIASSRSVPERAGRCLIRMLPALQCFVKRRAVGMRDCGGW
jgi:Ketopantoate reductase PanE/ApbA C terminal